MNKKIVAAIIALITIAIITGIWIIYINKDKLETFDSKNINLQKSDKLYIDVLDDTVTGTSLNYKIYNNTDTTVSYGVSYEIEKYEDGKWKEFGVEVSFIEIAIELESGYSKEEIIEWKSTYGKLKKGKYRLIKEVMGETLFDEFEIK